MGETLADVETLAALARSKSARRGIRQRQIEVELAANRGRATTILSALTKDRSQLVREWAANTARRVLGRDAVPLLLSMLEDRRVSMKEEALQQLEAIDVNLLKTVVPEIRDVFRRGGKSLHGPRSGAMFRLTRVKDNQAPKLFRAYARRQDPAWYDHSMPMVLADYIDDPGSIARRIRAHDHEWMRWLAEAAWILDEPGLEQALTEGVDGLPDAACREFCGDALRALALQRAMPHPSWDIQLDDA